MQKKENTGTEKSPSMYVASSDPGPLPKWIKLVAIAIVVGIAIVVVGGRFGWF